MRQTAQSDAGEDFAGDARLASLDPEGRLYNADLAPANQNQRNWSTYSLFAFWSNTAHNLGAYTFAAGLFALGLNAWQVSIGILGGAVIVFFGCLLSGLMGQATGVPFPVISRLSWGVFGANVPALIRALAAIAWYGIQTYLAAAAVNAIPSARFLPGLATGLSQFSLPRAGRVELGVVPAAVGHPAGGAQPRYGKRSATYKAGRAPSSG